MSRASNILRWLGYAGVGVLVIALLGATVVYVQSERILRRTYDIPASPIQVPSDSASIAEGRRLATILGCYNGCHGTTMEGQELFNDPGVARVVAPNLTRVRSEYTDAQLSRLLRHGVRSNGRSVFIMPSEAFARLSDRDVGRLIAFIRSVAEADGEPSAFEVGPLGRLGLAVGEFPPTASTIDHGAPREPTPAVDDTLAVGRYLARIACAECHGLDLAGGDETPSLTIAAAYSPDSFRELLRTGVPADGRDLELMDEVAVKRFSLLTDQEVQALFAYLSTLTTPIAKLDHPSRSPAPDPMPAYIAVQIEVHDPETYERYRALAPASIAAYDGHYLVRGGTCEPLEGTWNPRRLVILEFPSVDRARAWWASPEYAEAKALRQNSADTDMLVVEGYTGG